MTRKCLQDFIDKIIQGDCLKIMKHIPDNSVDLVLTDPPYGIDIGSMNFTLSLQGGVAKRTDYKNHNKDWDKQPITKKQLQELFRISRNQVIFGANNFANLLPNSRCWLVWDKRVEDKYSNDFSDCEFVWTSFDKPSRIIRFLWSGMLQQDMKNKEKRYHPTQKPVKVIMKILKWFSKKGDIVIDPFLGSGTTACACAKLRRKFIGIEISEKYCEIARKRVKPYMEQKNLKEILEVIK